MDRKQELLRCKLQASPFFRGMCQQRRGAALRKHLGAVIKIEDEDEDGGALASSAARTVV